MNILACTSFSAEQYEKFGKRFLETFLDMWPQEVNIVVGHEYTPMYRDTDFAANSKVPRDFNKERRVIWMPLSCHGARSEYMDMYGRLPAANGAVGRKDGKIILDYRLTSTRFANKVFALNQVLVEGRAQNADWLIWIDADTVWTTKIDDRFLKAVCPDNALISYLGRKDWDHSECGFVAYRVGHPIPRAFLRKFEWMYASGAVFALSQWHDSYVFDQIADSFELLRSPGVMNNLSEGVPGNHVWPATVLGEYAEHHKGPKAKGEAYTA